MHWVRSAAIVLLGLSVSLNAQVPLDKAARAWVDTTIKKMSIEQLVGQMIFARLDSTYLSSDSDAFDDLVKLIRETQIGGVAAFGGTDPVPQVMLGTNYGSVILGQPLELASLLNRLQSVSALPLLTASDFEWGVRMRIASATKFPYAMAFGAANDPQLAYEAGKVVGEESRALGVHVDLGPVADVNINPRNPVINTRSFGEDPAAVGAMVASWVRGLQDAGMLATLKHFPGHGDTDVDTHLGLAIVTHPREQLESIDLVPFRSGIAAGAAGVMVGHLEIPAIDPEKQPATFSAKVIDTLLRPGFDGLIYSDSLRMQSITDMVPPVEAAIRTVKAGVDVLLDSTEPAAAAAGIVAAVNAGTIPRAQIERSARRILEAKARLGLHRARLVSLDAAPLTLGGRKHEAIARTISERSVTLIKDAHNQVPLTTPKSGKVLYLSVLDYPSGWRMAAPGKALIPALKARWPSVDAVEVSDRTAPADLDLVRSMGDNYDVIVAGVFVRASSASGRMDLAAPVVKLLQDMAAASNRRSQPFVAMFFGNPYTPMFVTEIPAMLLTYDFSDAAEESAVRALAGEIAIGGKLPISLPGLFPVGHGLLRAATR